MKAARTSMTVSLLALAVCASPLAVAQDAGWYGGFNLGQSRATIDNARITQGLFQAGFNTSAISDDDRDFGYKVFGGYSINKYWAFEAGYFNMGRFGFTANTLPQGTLKGNIKLQGAFIDAVGTLPITDRFSVFGRVGVNHSWASDRFSGTGAVNVLDPHPSTSDTNYKFGVGLQYAFTSSLSMRAEAERYRINDAVGNKGDMDLYSVGLIYRFGAKPAPVAYAPEPAPAAPAPPPEPVAPPAPRIVTFSADSLFTFDKSIVRPAGKQELDKFAADVKSADYDTITVTGYTDRLGPQAYNQALSTRRAEAVKDYLVTVGGLPAEKIEARGEDGSDPVTKPGECTGNKATKQLIACLQPDRRVEVEVRGTK
ncbi:MAG: flagellar motor protein MotB [Rhodanobacter sp.]|nr:MAG: flagellar motor protein MotB [Rhodanobacter sp.]TAL93707.1 MAG: flagellar motor protein MotB [Rhodanobacter sp.]TAM40522.1 MAG: flagellar motor protein MotB [Rhodanobacter sp.]TAN28597.1 MAG: flagellar motor protein MotB [Rhodanobacter sp.]